MKIVIIAAIGSNYAIGMDGKIPWWGKQRSDVKHFIDLTSGFPIIIGRKTYESFPKRPLPGRTNIVITRQNPYPDPHCIGAGSLPEAITIAEQEGKKQAFILGGGEIYREALSIADEIELTVIHHDFPADTYFPAINRSAWKETSRTDHNPDEKNEHKYSFIRLTRVRKEQ